MVYGTRASAVNQMRIDNTVCGHCNETSSQTVTVFGKYAHILWIPFFPIGKIPVAECNNCKKTIPKEEFSSDLQAAYASEKSKIKSPKKHWIGLMLVAAIFLFGRVSAMFSSNTPSTSYNGPLSATALKSDYRAAYLETDMYSMTKTPLQASDSSAFLIKSFFDDFLSDEVDKSIIEYYTRAQGDKHITLIRMPEYGRFQPEDRLSILEMVSTLLETQENIAEKDKYIGIFNDVNFMGVKTPSLQEADAMISKQSIYEFYGEPKPDNPQE